MATRTRLWGLRVQWGRYRVPGGQRLMHARVHFLCRCLWCCYVQSILNRLQETHWGGLAREFSGSFGISLRSRKFWVQVTSSFLDGTYAGEQTSLPGKRARTTTSRWNAKDLLGQ